MISIVRLHALLTVDYNDATYSVTSALIWSMLEPSLGIILACVPVLKNLVPALFDSFSGSSAQLNNNASRRTARRFHAHDEYPLTSVDEREDVHSSGTQVLEGEHEKLHVSGIESVQEIGHMRVDTGA
jgi:hypothetical protein